VAGQFPVSSYQFKVELSVIRYQFELLDTLNPSTTLRVHPEHRRGMNWKLGTGNSQRSVHQTYPTYPPFCYHRSTVAFARWDPLRDLLAIQHRLERLASSGPQGWAPAVDLCETGDAFIVTAELPGLAREQIHIQVNDGRLTLQGRRDARVPCEQYHQVERGHGEFSRTFALPSLVDTERIAADLHHGVLTITLPKSPEKGPRRVDVS
jgi:HSP20 family protein